MIRLPPKSTRTDTLFPYTTLFRSQPADIENGGHVSGPSPHLSLGSSASRRPSPMKLKAKRVAARKSAGKTSIQGATSITSAPSALSTPQEVSRSDERRVGKECVSTGRSRWSEYH